MIDLIKSFFSSSKPVDKEPFLGWDSVDTVLVIFDQNEDDVMALVNEWKSEGKKVDVIRWITPKPKDKKPIENGFSERDIRFGKFKDPSFAKRWHIQVFVDCTVQSHKRLKKLLNKQVWQFSAGLNDAHAENYDLFIPSKGSFALRLNTLRTYLNLINKQKARI